MTSKEELEKMTVAQIREKLKNRKIPTSGTKSDLISRLHESLLAEEKLLEDSGPGGDNIDLSDVNVDEVLGVDDEKDSAVSSASETKPNDSLLSLCSPINEPLEQEKGIASLEKAQQTTLAAGVGTTRAQAIKTADNGQEKQQNEASENDGGVDGGKKAQRNDDNERKIQLKMAARLGVPLAESEAKRTRATRFGENGRTDKDQKAKRASRFGELEETVLKRKSTLAEDEKMLKRAERFGLPLKRSSADTVNSDSAERDDTPLQKRAKRFGVIYEGVDEGSKKAARAKRFGL